MSNLRSARAHLPLHSGHSLFCEGEAVVASYHACGVDLPCFLAVLICKVTPGGEIRVLRKVCTCGDFLDFLDEMLYFFAVIFNS